MRDRPNGAELLRQARTTLLEELLDELPESRRYEVLMVANAMAIAARELESGQGIEAERREVEGVLGPSPQDDPDRALESLGRQLAAEIRQGQRDAETKIHRLLSRDAVARLKISNPKALTAEDG